MLFALVPTSRADDEPAAEREISDLATGTAGEHLVCADLLLQGYAAFMADQNCAYDVVAEVRRQLVRIQVKSTLCAKRTPHRQSHIPSYQWSVRRAGKNRQRVYAADDFDLLALVALDIHRIAYLPPSRTKQTVIIRPPEAGRLGKHFDDFTFERATREWLAVS